MTPETLHPCAHRIALTYPFTEHCWPFGPEYDVFKVDGRIFMITMTIRGRALVNLKAEPQKSLLNQQIYRSIEPGYHMNKKHWITVVPGEDISEDLLAEQPVARIRGDPALREMAFIERRQHPDHRQPAPGAAGFAVRVVQRRAEFPFQRLDMRAAEGARRDVDLDVELPELGLERRIGDGLQRLFVRHRRIPGGIHEVELDLQAEPRLGDVELPVREHRRKRVQTPPRLGSEKSAILPRESPCVDAVAHEQTLLRRGDARRGACKTTCGSAMFRRMSEPLHLVTIPA